MGHEDQLGLGKVTELSFQWDPAKDALNLRSIISARKADRDEREEYRKRIRS